jgi:hypothetical protein
LANTGFQHISVIQLLAKIDNRNVPQYLQRILSNVLQLIFRHNSMREEKGVGVGGGGLVVEQQRWK